MRKTIFTILLAIAASVGHLFAQEEIDGLYYYLNDDKTATVTSNGSMYSGDIIIPPSVTYKGETYLVTCINSYAFKNCTNLTSVTIPHSVTMLTENPFFGCTGLTSIVVETGNPKFDSRDNCNAIIETATNTLCVGCKNTIIPNSVTCIGEWAFCKCTGLTSIEIPNSVTSIGIWAFSDCTSLMSIDIGNSVTSISAHAFEFCTGLTAVTIGNSVTSIGYGAFERCDGLTSIICEATVPPTLNSISSFDNTNCPIYVPCGTLDTYKANTYWQHYAARLQYLASPYTITTSCNAAMGSVSLPSSLTICDNLIPLTATANSGYHFDHWSDGNTDNPRNVVLVQDTAFTAEFAKNKYTVSAVSNNSKYGRTSGDVVAEYLDNVSISATPQYGYHFTYWLSNNKKYYDNPLSVKVNNDVTYTAYFDVNSYTIDVHTNPIEGIVSAPAEANFMEQVTLTATPQKGYEFAQWSDGVTDNPRMFYITQDTAFTAEFAKAQYTIATAVNDAERGTAIGDKVVNYLASVTLTATANHGYHFDHWQSGTKTYSANPLKVTATGNAIYTAYFVPNTYSVNAYSDNTSWGSVSAPSQADYLEWITLTANPVKGAEFVQWSDGNKDNPRYMLITQDTTISAEFAVLTSGHYNAEVYWHFSNSTLHISGYGDMYGECEDSWELLIPQIQTVEVGQNITHVIPAEMGKLYNLTSVVWNATNYTAPASESETPFYSKRNRITEFVFGKQVKKVPAYLCYEMTGLNKITLGSNVTNIGKHAFDGCEDLAAITCEAMTPPNCGTDAFAGVSIFIPVYVPVSSIEKYAKAPIWKDFDTFSSIQAEQKEVTSVQAQPSDNSVVLEWPAADADVYTLVIKCNGVIFCTLSFNAQGQLLGIQFVQGRNGAHNATYATQTARGWQFTITSLEAGTTYDYTVTAKKSDDTPVYTQSGSFTTTGTATGVDAVVDAESAPVKVIRNGQLYILHDGKMYTVQGQEVR